VIGAVVAVLCVALAMAAEHYAAAWHTGGRMWPRVVSYVLGVLGVLGPVSVWLVWAWMCSEQVDALAVLIVMWGAVATAGATVGVLYVLDGWLAARREAREAREREQALLTRVGDDANEG